jgi:hypothetical protein
MGRCGSIAKAMGSHWGSSIAEGMRGSYASMGQGSNTRGVDVGSGLAYGHQ